MDNNFENGYTGNEPQRPFTEKPAEQPAQNPSVQQNPAYGFNPEKPLMHPNQPQQEPQQGQPQQAPPRQDPPRTPDQGFNPIEHTAMYQDGAFSDQAAPAQPRHPAQPPQNGQPPFGARPQRPAPANNDYSRQGYYNPAMNGNYKRPYNQAQPPMPLQRAAVPPQQPQQQYVTPLQGSAPAPQANAQPENPYAIQNSNRPQQDYYMQTFESKPKGNKGLIAVIIVLAVLLAASFTGILIYAFSQSGGNNTQPTENFNNGNGIFNFPDSTNPFFEQQPATEAIAHDESDYSDKVIKDYKGLDLAAKPSDAETNKSYGAEYAFEKVSPSVVGVLGYTDNDKKVKGSEGSGIIISADGYVLTNSHVVLNSKTALALYVITSDGKEYKAGVVGFDQRTDIAVLKLDNASGLTPATFGDSDSLILGEDIIIIGNPGGVSFQNSMTKGIVSALDRDASKKSIVKYIQTDAAINPGNSGGPAVNMYGQVIGIATAKIVDEKYEGMGFCIPSSSAKSIIDSLMKNGYVEGRVKIGISGVAVSASESSMYGIPTGIMIEEVDPNGPCGKIGLSENDIITEADGQAITSFSDIYNVLEQHKAGDKIKIKYSKYEEGQGNFGGSYTEKEAEIELVADEG